MCLHKYVIQIPKGNWSVIAPVHECKHSVHGFHQCAPWTYEHLQNFAHTFACTYIYKDDLHQIFFFLLVCINVWSLKVMKASICANILKQAVTLNWYFIDSVEVNQRAKSNMLVLYMARLENSHRIWKVARSAIWNRCYVTVSVDRVYFTLAFHRWWGEPPYPLD